VTPRIGSNVISYIFIAPLEKTRPGADTLHRASRDWLRILGQELNTLLVAGVLLVLGEQGDEWGISVVIDHDRNVSTATLRDESVHLALISDTKFDHLGPAFDHVGLVPLAIIDSLEGDNPLGVHDDGRISVKYT